MFFCPYYKIQGLFFESFPLGFLVAALILLPPLASAQSRILPSISVGLEHDDNPSLNTSAVSAASVDGYLIEADATLIFESPLTEFSITPRVLLRRYNSAPELDSDDLFLDFDYGYTGQRSRFRFRGSYGDETTRTAERSNVDFDVEEPGEIPNDDSGRVLGTEKRQRIQVNPEWSYKTGPKSLVRISARYLDASFDDGPVQLFSDYQEASGTVSFEHELSERTAINLDGYYRENSFDVLDRDFSGFGVTAGLKRKLTEKARLILRIGADSTEDETGEKQTNPVGEISLIRDMKTSRILATYRRAVSGSGVGSLSVRDSIGLNFTRDLSQRVSVGAGVRAYQTSALDKDDDSFSERDYVQLRALMSWNFTRAFAIELDYIYTNIERENLLSGADSNLVNLWFRYRPRQ